MNMKTIKAICLLMALALIPAFSGCWYVAAGGAGAYGGYKAKEKGYTVQSPVKKEGKKKKAETTEKEDSTEEKDK